VVVGSYPPVPGLAAAATVAAVRRAWHRNDGAAGCEVVVVSPRPSAAQLVMAATGAAVGPALSRLRPSVASGRGSSPTAQGRQEVVLCLEPGWPFGRGHRRHLQQRGGPLNRPVGQSLNRPLNLALNRALGRSLSREELERAARSLATALSSFDRAELVVTGNLGVPPDILSLLWPVVEKVTASSEEVAGVLRAAGAPGVTVVEPYAGAGLPATVTVAAVSPLEPADWLLVARGRRLIGSAARRVLGPRAPAVRAYLLRTWIQSRKTLLRLAGRGGPSKSHT
jgi:hypothetical protein